MRKLGMGKTISYDQDFDEAERIEPEESTRGI
jgi:predicted nucleic acid-binding protein